MTRIANTRTTSIYWLVDTRTGIPFYCGKTVLPPHQRLACHKYEAIRGERRVHVKVRECVEHLTIRVMESVAPEGDWVAREKRWIHILRETNPDCCNTADGGAGAPGWVPTAETRAKIVAGNLGRKHTPETRAKLSAIGMGRKRSPESVAKSAAGNRGKKHTPEALAKMSASQKQLTNRPRHTPEHKAKISSGNKGKKRSPEQCARVSKGQKEAHWARQRARGACASSFLALPG